MELSTKYNLDISMFERLINNGFDNVTLNTQRRMRPEISRVVREIYPTLADADSVLNFPNVLGMNNKNYFFLNHDFKEDQLVHIQSKTNPKEADMIIRFTNYLLQQNYKPGDITILSLYAGQLLTIKSKIMNDKRFPRDHPLRGVRITTVDNYQGEENKIIILSLVRNNHHNSIGFLKASNRVCVALSRAIQGLYIFGNA